MICAYYLSFQIRSFKIGNLLKTYQSSTKQNIEQRGEKSIIWKDPKAWQTKSLLKKVDYKGNEKKLKTQPSPSPQ